MSENQNLRQAALFYHEHPKPGKLEIRATKPMANARDLARAYSPGVAEACLEIKGDPTTAARYTSRANLVAVVSNGTAVLGLGNIGPLASKPVMEGKAVLFKKFANIDCFDIELDESDPEKLAEIVCALGPTFGAINLEDIKAPDCFIVEKICRERMEIPVFHDDQHGTAIVVGAAAKNALHVAGKAFDEIKIVSTGGGAAGIACLNMLVKMGVRRENIWLCDIHGLVYEGREQDMNPQKAVFAQDTDKRTLDEVIDGADLFLGLSRRQRPDPGHGAQDVGAPDHLCPGQSQPRDHARPGARGRPGCDHRHRTQRLSQPGQQRAVLSVHLPGRAGCRRHRDQRRHAAGLHRRHRRSGPRHHQRRGGRRLQRRAADLRRRLPDPQALRSAAGGGGLLLGGPRGDGERRSHPADRRFRGLQGQTAAIGFQVGAADAPGLRGRPRRLAADHLRRGRGRAGAARGPGDPRGDHRDADPDRPPRGDRSALRAHGARHPAGARVPPDQPRERPALLRFLEQLSRS